MGDWADEYRFTQKTVDRVLEKMGLMVPITEPTPAPSFRKIMGLSDAQCELPSPQMTHIDRAKMQKMVGAENETVSIRDRFMRFLLGLDLENEAMKEKNRKLRDAIQTAIVCSDLWLPVTACAGDADEVRALQKLHTKLLEALK